MRKTTHLSDEPKHFYFYCQRAFLALFGVLVLSSSLPALAHGSFALHRQDFYEVLGLEENKKLDQWMRLISSELIDNAKGKPREAYQGLAFYDYVKQQFPPFKCKHRLLFHWGYNARPWSDLLDKKMVQYRFDSLTIQRLQAAFVIEQKYRNSLANAETEKTFGLASGGKEAAYANAMVSILYDVHLLGDYTPDNHDLDGLGSLQFLVGDLINALRKLDEQVASPLIKSLAAESKRTERGVQTQAVQLLKLLKEQLPTLLQTAQQGDLAKRFRQQGFQFRPSTTSGQPA